MSWTIRRKLMALGLLGLVLIGAVSVAGMWGMTRVEGANRDLGWTAVAMRNHLEAERLNDALRADVLAALHADARAEREHVRADGIAHARALRERMAANGDLPLDAPTRSALDELRPALEASVVDAEGIVRDALEERRADAEARRGPYLERFDALEHRMGQVSDLLEQRGARVTRAALGDVRSARAANLAIVAIALLGMLLAASIITRQITGPLQDTVDVLDGIAAGDLTPRLGRHRHDEVGRMSEALNRALDGIGRTLTGIADNAQALGGASEELAAVSHEMSATARETTQQTTVVSSAASQVSANVATVASAAQQMGSSIREIAHNAHEAAEVASRAVKVAATADRTVQKLGASSAQIDHVVKVITAIAEQTNLLALNATIEAARAGEAGKGFAVVANEVKELARETAKATEDIGRKIEAIQADTRDAVKSIGEIGDIIDRISEIQTAIASAVEQQSAATGEITRNMNEAANGTNEIAANIGSLVRGVESTSSVANDTQRAANELAMMATELQRLVGQFRYAQSGPGKSPRVASMPPRPVPAGAVARAAAARSFDRAA